MFHGCKPHSQLCCCNTKSVHLIEMRSECIFETGGWIRRFIPFKFNFIIYASKISHLETMGYSLFTISNDWPANDNSHNLALVKCWGLGADQPTDRVLGGFTGTCSYWKIKTECSQTWPWATGQQWTGVIVPTFLSTFSQCY